MLLEHLLDIADVTIFHVVTADERVLLVIVAVVGFYGLEFVSFMSLMLRTTAQSDAGDGAEHDGKEKERDVDKNVGDFLLTIEPLKRIEILGSEASETHHVTDDNDDNRGRGRN